MGEVRHLTDKPESPNWQDKIPTKNIFHFSNFYAWCFGISL